MPTAPWLCCALFAFAAGGEDGVRERAKKVVERERVQARLEFGELDPEDASLLDLKWSPKLPFSVPTPGVGDLGTALLYTGVAAVVLVLLAVVARSVARQQGDAATATNPLHAAAAEAMDRSADELFAEADRWAEQGRWEEAVHTLLLAAIRGLADEFGPPRKSRTSRELLAHFQLEGDRRTAFRRLVAAAEQVVFGGRETDEELFRECRALAMTVREAPT